MSTNAIQQQSMSQPRLQTAPKYEEKMSWYMRWFALLVLSAGYIVSIITGIVGFSITRDSHFLLFVSPTLFTPAIFYLVPMDQRRYELKKLKIQMSAQQKVQRQQNKQQAKK